MIKGHGDMKLAVNLLMLLISLVISCLFGEFIIRMVYPQNLTGQCFEYTDKGLLVNRQKGSSPLQYGKLVIRYNYYYPHLRDTPLKQGGIRVLTIGDSFTFGFMVDKSNQITYLLQQDTDKEFGKEKFYFLNAGTSGWGTADYTAYLEDFGEIIKPKIVLVILNTDDIGRSVKSKLFEFMPGSGMDLKRNILKVSYFKRFVNSIPGYEWLLEHSHLVQLFKRSWQLATQKSTQKKSSAIREFGPNSKELRVPSEYSIKLGQALFIRLDKWCRDHGADLYITTTGWSNEEDVDSLIEPTSVFMKAAPEFFRSINVPYYDIFSDIQKAKNGAGKRFVFPDGHPNEAGNRLISEEIWNNLLKDRLQAYLTASGTHH